MRFWDIASGEEVRQADRPEFAFVDAGARRTEQQTNHHFLKATDGSTLMIAELLPHGGVQDRAAPVACFRASQWITSMHCRGATICLGCGGSKMCTVPSLLPLMTCDPSSLNSTWFRV